MEFSDAVPKTKTGQLQFDSPVSSSLLLKDHVAVVHPVLCGDKDAGMRVVFRRLPQHVVHNAFPVFPHVPERPPHNVDRVVGLAEEVLGLLQQQGNTGMRDDPQSRASAHIVLKPPCGCVVHPPDAGRTIYLRAGALAQHLTRAGHDAAQFAVQLQGLEERKQVH